MVSSPLRPATCKTANAVSRRQICKAASLTRFIIALNYTKTSLVSVILLTHNPNTLSCLNTAFPLGSGDPNYMVHALQDLQDRERSEPLAESQNVVATSLHHSIGLVGTGSLPSRLSTQNPNTLNFLNTSFPLGSGDPSYIITTCKTANAVSRWQSRGEEPLKVKNLLPLSIINQFPDEICLPQH